MVPEELSVLGDGAEWVWSVLDVVTKAFRRVVDQVGEAPLGALGWEDDLPAASRGLEGPHPVEAPLLH